MPVDQQPEPIVVLAGVSKKYGSKLAVVDANFEIRAGEVFAFLGPNGAGKTTTLKLIAGLLQPTQGTVTVVGHSMASRSLEGRRVLSFVPDQPYVYEKLTGYEFLTFVADLYGMSAADANIERERMIETFELSEFVHDLAETYSHGMRQRLAFAGALLHRPRVLILDEPMVGLDPRSVRIVKDHLRMEARRGMAIFMSTHTLGIAEEIADRIAIVHRGRMIRCATLAELRLEFSGQQSLEDYFLQVTQETAA